MNACPMCDGPMVRTRMPGDPQMAVYGCVRDPAHVWSPMGCEVEYRGQRCAQPAVLLCTRPAGCGRYVCQRHAGRERCRTCQMAPRKPVMTTVGQPRPPWWVN
jgi:hypothetical protein